jgi:protein-disulfide isomerase
MPKEIKILGLIALVVIGIGAALAFKKPPVRDLPGVPLDSQNLMRDKSHMTGSTTAKVKLVEFGDFQCPACAAAHPVVKQIKEVYKDNPNFSFVFRNFPLSGHPYADEAAEAAEAAGAQGKFWEMHDMLYEKQSQWAVPQAVEYFKQYAQDLGLNAEQLQQEVRDKKYADIINADYSDGVTLNVNSTPTFFLNGEAIVGVPKFEELKQKIDQKLAE